MSDPVGEQDVVAALNLLAAGSGRRLAELAVFVEGAWIERELVCALWSETGPLSAKAADALFAQLVELGMVRVTSGQLRLVHGVRPYLRQLLGDDGLTFANAAVLQAAPQPWWSLPAEARYLWRHLPHHLRIADQSSQVEGLLGDLRWLHGAVRACGSGGVEAELRAIDAPWATVLADRLALSAYFLEAAAEWDAEEPALSRDSLLGNVDRQLPAYQRDALSNVLLNELAGLPVLRGRIHAYRATLPAAARLVTRWPLPGPTDPRLRRVLAAQHTERCMVSADGAWVVATGSAGAVRLWEFGTGQVRLDLEQDCSLMGVAPDSSWLLTADGFGGLVQIRNTHNGEARAILKGSGPVSSAAVAPDGSWVAIAGYDGTVTIWACETWELLAAFEDSGSFLTAWSTGEEPRLAVSRPAGVTLWDPVAGRKLAVLDHDSVDAVFVEAIAPDGSWLVTCCRDGTVRLWDLKTSSLRTVLAHDLPWPRCMSVDPGGSWLGIAGQDGRFVVWDTAAGSAVATLTDETTQGLSCAVAPDGSWLAVGSKDCLVRVWDTATWQAVVTLPASGEWITRCVVTPDGSQLATTGPDGPIKLWDTTTWVAYGDLGVASGVSDLVAAADGSWLAVTHAGVLMIWSPSRSALEHPRSAAATSAVVSTQGSWLASSGAGVQELRDLGSGVLRWSSNLIRPISRWAVGPDGSWLATADGYDRTVRIVDAASGDVRTTLDGHDGAVRDCVVAPDGSWLATAGDDATVRLWDPASGALITELVGHTAAVHTCVVAPDGTWLASAGDDKAVRVWDTGTWRLRHVLAGHAGSVRTCVVAPDSSWLGAVDFGDVMFWDVGTGEVLLQCEGRHLSTSQCVIDPQERWLFRIGLHGGQNGQAGDVCDLATHIEDDGERWLSRGMTDLELVGGAVDGAVSPDGRWLAITSWKGHVTIWDTSCWASVAAIWTEGAARRCGWLSDSSGLWVVGDFGVKVFDFEPPGL